MEVHWSPSARRDLQQIHSYIGQSSEEYARRMIERIVGPVERLRLFPESERANVRQIFVAHYRIIYRTHPDLIEVALVLHGARQLPENWR